MPAKTKAVKGWRGLRDLLDRFTLTAPACPDHPRAGRDADLTMRGGALVFHLFEAA